ncbi:MAG: T9SS type A sorting domain-containing protein [Bacteroidota bacterium]
MKPIIFLGAIFLLAFLGGSAQSLSPAETNEFCASVTLNFSFSISGDHRSDLSVSSGSYTTVSSTAPTYSSPTTTMAFTIFFTDVAYDHTITINYSGSPHTYTFSKIKSIATDRAPSVPSSVTKGICNTTPFTYSFAAVPWKNQTVNTTFGAIPDFRYSVPQGWKVGSHTSTGPTDYVIGTNSETITPDAFSGGYIAVQAYNTCAASLAAGIFQSTSISRPQLILKEGGNTTINVSCGDATARTFTVDNGSSATCATFTWNIANKGWLYGGSIPSSAVSTGSTPSITLTPSNSTATPVQDVSVTISDGTSSLTSTVTVHFIVPTLGVAYVLPYDLDCNKRTINGSVTNAPSGSYSVAWNTTSGDYIDGTTSSTATFTGSPVSVTKNSSTGNNDTKLTMTAGCGTIESNIISFSSCLNWGSNFSSFFPYTAPASHEPIYCTISFDGGSDVDYADPYEWYVDRLDSGGGLIQIFSINEYWLDTYNWPCNSGDVYVRAIATTSGGAKGSTALTYVGHYEPICYGAQMAAIPINVHPNPISDKTTVEFSNKGIAYTIMVTDFSGNPKLKFKTKNDKNIIDFSNFSKGKYFIVIDTGKKKISRQVIK